MSLINKSAVRDETDLNVGAESYGELAERVREMIDRAESRARENGRKTVKARDV